MSVPNFKEKLDSSLAHSYALYGPVKKKTVKKSISRTALATVVEKLTLKAQKSSHAAIDSDDVEEEIDVVTDQPISTPAEGQESVSEASALETSETEKLKRANSLADPQLLWENFFSGILDDAADAVEENADESEIKYTHLREQQKAGERGEQRTASVCSFPMKLMLFPLKSHRRVATVFASLLEKQFGPLHVALQVGGVVLEWNTSSLVEPHLCVYEDQLLELEVQRHSEWVQYTRGRSLTMLKAAEDLDFSEQIELIYTVSTEKKKLIDELINVIILYNTHFFYNVIDRNCQHFVRDALAALQVNLPKIFPGGLGKYFNALVKGKTPSVPSEFKAHADLDRYVREGAIADMPQHDLEFLLALYFRFHLESRSRLKKNSKAMKEWQCQEKECGMEKIEALIQVESMKIHTIPQDP